MFWREKRVRILQFNKVIDNTGETFAQNAYVEIPAFNTKYDEKPLSNLPAEYLYESKDDVIQKTISGFWDDTETGRNLYSKFSRKKSYILRGFLESDVQGYERNKIYRFILNEELYKLVSSFLTNNEIDVVPVDPVDGLDFIINVTSKQVSINGTTQQLNSYSTSTWARKETSLSEEEKKYLKDNELPPLLTYIPTRPTSEQEQAMVELFNASMEGEPYDIRRWGKYFKPNNIQFDSDGVIKVDGGKATTVTPNYTYDTVRTETVSQPVVKEEVVESAPQITESPIKVSELINEHKEETPTQDPKALINDIMSKYKIQK